MSDVTFQELFGREPDGRWAGPGRVNLIGEHVDYAQGLCLPFAIAERTVVEVAARDDDRVRMRSLAEEGGFDGVARRHRPGAPGPVGRLRGGGALGAARRPGTPCAGSICW